MALAPGTRRIPIRAGRAYFKVDAKSQPEEIGLGKARLAPLRRLVQGYVAPIGPDALTLQIERTVMASNGRHTGVVPKASKGAA